MTKNNKAYRLSLRAEEDLAKIYLDGKNKYGATLAHSYIDKLKYTFNFLAEFPRAARLREEITPAIRAYPCQSHLIMYDIVDSSTILIIRVRHGHEDWMSGGSY